MDKPAYISWKNNREMALAMREAGQGLEKARPVLRSTASSLYLNVRPGMSVRDEMTRGDYESFRRSEALPERPEDVIRECMEAYRKFGVVRNVIDLMADFGIQGIDVSHPVKAVERFFKAWFRKVGGPERSERFLNIFYRAGNVIVTRSNAPLPAYDEREMRAQGGPPTGARSVPVGYTFWHPLSVELAAPALAALAPPVARSYYLRLPRQLVQAARRPTEQEAELIRALPGPVRQALAAGQDRVLLPPTDTLSFFYKKDDWQAWSEPMLFPVLVDLKLLEKMKLADAAALDGAVSSIRVWKLGSLEHKILPSEATILRLADTLAQNVGGGVMDLVWGPEIELLETSTEVHRFLGQTKYGPCLGFIYEGLGVPPTLTAAGGERGMTNNYFSLKTLVQRLEYGRQALKSFWDNEMRLVQKALNIPKPPTLVFDRMSLDDESAERRLLLELADRNLISGECLLEQLGLAPEIEEYRVRREEKKRKGGSMPRKASPFHADRDFELEKIFAQSGAHPAEQFGLELPGPAPLERQPPAEAPPGVSRPGPGRPKGSVDVGPRKQSLPGPRRSAKVAAAVARMNEYYAQMAQAIGTSPSSDLAEQAEELAFELLWAPEGSALKDALACGRPPEWVTKLRKLALEKASLTGERGRWVSAAVYALAGGQHAA